MTERRERVSHYRIESVLGQGGFGVVYLATDELLHRRAALKFLSPSQEADAQARRRFIQEARAAATLIHPNAAVLYEVGTDGDDLFLAMEYVPGLTLRELVAQGALPWTEVIDVALEILAALGEAHAKGIVHRDIKGANIKRTPDGRIKVMDFGLAQSLSGSTLTGTGGTGTIAGTPAYMSPQQVVGDSVDHRTDLFSLGVLMYELVTGRLPFSGDLDVAVAHSILHEDPITIRELCAEVPAELEQIVFKAMMKSVSERYQSAAEMTEDLIRFRDHDRRRRAGAHEELDLLATREAGSARRERFRAPMVGRDRPFQRLREIHGEVRDGEGATVCISGEAGIGKSRLLDEFCQSARRDGTRVVIASCLFGGGTSSYFPFAEALRSYFALRGVQSASTLQSFLLDRAPRLGGSLPVLNRFLRYTFATNGPTSEEELWEVLDQVLAFVAEERPLILIVEDLQWADEGTIRLFQFLGRRVPRRRFLLIGTYRPEEATGEARDRPHPLRAALQVMSREERFERIELHRLGKDEVRTVLERLYPGHEWGEEFASLLYRETEGNPFFMVEILKLLSAEGLLCQRDGRWVLTAAVETISIPDKVYDVVMLRLSRLSPHEREILELGAVEGDVFHSGTILRGLAIERMNLLRTLQFLEQIHHLIHAAGPQYHFDHSKIREILYDSIPPELRIEYHTVVGQFLAESFGASEEHAGIIAHNLIAAGLKEDALPFLNRAAAAAAKLFAHSDAIRHLERAESLLHDLYPQSPPVDRVRELSEIRQRRGDHEYAAGRYRAALASYETALVLRQSAPDPTREAELTRAIGRVEYLLGHAAESQHAYEEAIARYAAIVQETRASGDDERLNQALRELGKLYFFRGNLEESERLLREAIELAERRGDDRLRAAAINNLTGIPFVRGDLEQAMAGHRVCLGIRERARDDLGLAQTHKNIGILHYRMGEIEEGERHLEEALAGYRKAGDRRGESVTLRHLGNLLHYRGDQAGARRHWEASLYLCRELGNNEDLCSCLNNLGLLHFEQGHYASAERLYREALEIRSSLNPNDHSMAIYHDNLAELYIDLHQLARAEEELRLADQLAGALDAAPILTEVLAKRARIASQRGEHEQGRDFARAALSVAEPTGHVESLVEALLALAEVELGAGRFGESKRAAGQARDVAHWSRMPHFELRAALVASRAAWMEGGALTPLAELREFVERAETREYKALAAQLRHLMGEIHARSSEWEEAAADLTRAAEDMKEILMSLTEEDRRSLVHHPDWRSLIGALLDTLIHLGRRDEAISYLAALGMGTCEVAEPRTAEVQTVS